MRYLRTNFGPDFCGRVGCPLCYCLAADTQTENVVEANEPAAVFDSWGYWVSIRLSGSWYTFRVEAVTSRVTPAVERGVKPTRAEWRRAWLDAMPERPLAELARREAALATMLEVVAALLRSAPVADQDLAVEYVPLKEVACRS